jgi:hypothetical protein
MKTSAAMGLLSPNFSLLPCWPVFMGLQEVFNGAPHAMSDYKMYAVLGAPDQPAQLSVRIISRFGTSVKAR